MFHRLSQTEDISRAPDAQPKSTACNRLTPYQTKTNGAPRQFLCPWLAMFGRIRVASFLLFTPLLASSRVFLPLFASLLAPTEAAKNFTEKRLQRSTMYREPLISHARACSKSAPNSSSGNVCTLLSSLKRVLSVSSVRPFYAGPLPERRRAAPMRNLPAFFGSSSDLLLIVF